MKPVITHPWDLSPTEAEIIQRRLAPSVSQQDIPTPIHLIAGTDVAYSKDHQRLVAAVVVLAATTLEIVETVVIEDIEHFPYIPGLFSFRELPPLIKAFEKLQHRPDLVVCDGQGYAHPRRFGLACHLGVLLDIPTIGCGKTRLLGDHTDVGIQRGDQAPLIDNEEIIGRALRTQYGINPLYVSIGHKISLTTACDWILQLCPRYRLPETTRQADHLVNLHLKSRAASSPSY